MHGECVHQYPGVEVPELYREVGAAGEQVVGLVGLALRVGVEKTVDLALVTFHDTVLWPAWSRMGWGWGGGGKMEMNERKSNNCTLYIGCCLATVIGKFPAAG